MKNKELKNESENKKKNIILLALKRHKISLIIVLFFICTSTTLAWFIYNKTVDFSLNVHVKAWDIQLGDGEGETYTFDIDEIYPGMADATDSVNIINNGEMAATITAEVQSLKLFGVEQTQGTDYNVTSNNGVYTITGYPFSIEFQLSSDTLAVNAVTTLNASVVWDYANNETACIVTDQTTGEERNICDEEDTEYGERSYEYSQTNPTGKSLEIVLRLKFVEQLP